MTMVTSNQDTVMVVIGRNEGDRLVRCLQSVRGQTACVIYVDSASQDQSVAHAQRLGAEVVALDMSLPFSAARARNAGWRHALQLHPDARYVQFVDGDCEVFPNWVSSARQVLEQQPDVVAVCGRRKERFPDASVYNRMCDIEWNTPVGEARSVGGDAMFRARAMLDSGGYRDDVIAGEEPELCVRLRQAGGKILRIDADMTLHDAAILRWSQWWTRSKRGGYAFALGAHLHGAEPERHWVAEYRRALLWGLLLPVTLLTLAIWAPLAALVASLIYPLQLIRLKLKSPPSAGIGWRYAALTLMTKAAEAQGCARFWRERLQGSTPTIIEYK